MQKEKTLARGCAEMLKQLREEKKLTISAMANAVNVDAKTWKRYEDGTSAPSVPEFVRIYHEMDSDALRAALDYIYPDVYQDITPESNDEELRKAAVHFMKNVATANFIRCLDFITFGNHGSNIAPQLQEFVMIEHLPLKYRIIVAETVNSLYQLAALEGNLVNMENVQPDVELFADAIAQAKESVISGSNAYTTS